LPIDVRKVGSQHYTGPQPADATSLARAVGRESFPRLCRQDEPMVSRDHSFLLGNLRFIQA
jgi:hypothetical protein